MLATLPGLARLVAARPGGRRERRARPLRSSAAADARRPATRRRPLRPRLPAAPAARPRVDAELLGGVASAMALVDADPHARPPRRSSRSARLRAARRPRARRDRAPAAADARAPGAHPGLAPRRRTSRARRSRTSSRGCARSTAGRSRTRSSTSPTTPSASWLRRRSSPAASGAPTPPEERRALLERLAQVEAFETYLRRAFIGQKQFSIEGLDALVPMLDEAVELAAEGGAHEVVIGIAHRGRLNVLAHTVGRSLRRRCSASSRASARIDALVTDPEGGTGDVKYHLAASESRVTRAGEIQVTLAAEPEPPRGGRPGRRGPRARRADRSLARRRDPRPDRRAADPDPRRRVVRRPGRRRGDVQPALARRLLDRRHAPRHRQQPGRLHDRPRRRALDAVLERPRQGLRRARSCT